MGVQVREATYSGEKHLSATSRAFISFNWGGRDIEEFNLIVVFNNDRLSKGIYFDFTDITTTLEGKDGQLYWKSYYNPGALTFTLATDGMTAREYEDFKQFFKPGREEKLILTEYPNRYCMARVAAAPALSVLPFEDTVYFHGNELRSTLYKGEITLSFVMDDPYWYSLKQFIDTSDDSYFDGETAIRVMYEDGTPTQEGFAYDPPEDNQQLLDVEKEITNVENYKVISQLDDNGKQIKYMTADFPLGRVTKDSGTSFETINETVAIVYQGTTGYRSNICKANIPAGQSIFSGDFSSVNSYKNFEIPIKNRVNAVYFSYSIRDNNGRITPYNLVIPFCSGMSIKAGTINKLYVRFMVEKQQTTVGNITSYYYTVSQIAVTTNNATQYPTDVWERKTKELYILGNNQFYDGSVRENYSDDEFLQELGSNAPPVRSALIVEHPLVLLSKNMAKIDERHNNEFYVYYPGTAPMRPVLSFKMIVSDIASKLNEDLTKPFNTICFSNIILSKTGNIQVSPIPLTEFKYYYPSYLTSAKEAIRIVDNYADKDSGVSVLDLRNDIRDTITHRDLRNKIYSYLTENKEALKEVGGAAGEANRETIKNKIITFVPAAYYVYFNSKKGIAKVYYKVANNEMVEENAGDMVYNEYLTLEEHKGYRMGEGADANFAIIDPLQCFAITSKNDILYDFRLDYKYTYV